MYDIYDTSTAKQITKLDEFAFSTGETQAAYVYITPKKDIFLSIRCPQLHLGEPIISVVSINLKHAHHSILKQYLNKQGTHHDQLNFTKRETECIRLLSQGLSAKEIAQKLNIKSKTVEFHISNAKEKLNYYKSSKLTYLVGKFHALFSD